VSVSKTAKAKAEAVFLFRNTNSRVSATPVDIDHLFAKARRVTGLLLWYIYVHMNFQEKVYAIVKKIPKGKVLTYKQVAAKIGKPGASRAVGTVLGKNFDPKIPCHRVIRSDGKIGNYNRGGMRGKIKILKKEGYLK
jgi:methylated-DNA-[protein]-cysteine S-methyltransferase